jgi:hypothetical protein
MGIVIDRQACIKIETRTEVSLLYQINHRDEGTLRHWNIGPRDHNHLGQTNPSQSWAGGGGGNRSKNAVSAS